ncbi:MAG: twin-arginine translocase subunit TatC [Hyphomicrobiaceae bacterium]
MPPQQKPDAWELLWPIAVVFLVAFGLCICFADRLYGVLVEPYRFAVQSVFGRFTQCHHCGHSQEYFFTQMKLALFGAIVLTFPIATYRIGLRFLADQFSTLKDRLLWLGLLPAVLFALGSSLCLFAVAPFGLAALFRSELDLTISLNASIYDTVAFRVFFVALVATWLFVPDWVVSHVARLSGQGPHALDHDRVPLPSGEGLGAGWRRKALTEWVAPSSIPPPLAPPHEGEGKVPESDAMRTDTDLNRHRGA